MNIIQDPDCNQIIERPDRPVFLFFVQGMEARLIFFLSLFSTLFCIEQRPTT